MLGARRSAVAPVDKSRCGLDGELIAEPAKSGHGPVGHRRQDRLATPGFPGVGVGQVKLDDDAVEGCQGVVKCPARVREGAGVDHDRFDGAARVVNGCDEVGLVLALQVLQLES